MTPLCGFGIDDGAQGAAVGQVPDLLAGLGRLVAGEMGFLPATEIGLFGQHASRPETIQDLGFARVRASRKP